MTLRATAALSSSCSIVYKQNHPVPTSLPSFINAHNQSLHLCSVSQQCCRNSTILFVGLPGRWSAAVASECHYHPTWPF